MKRWLIVLFLIGFMFVFVSASVNVSSYDVKDKYTSFSNIVGTTNLSFSGENYDEGIVLTNGSQVGLGDFLVNNGVEFNCFPKDCSTSYESSFGAVDKSVHIPSMGEKYIGFVLTGNNVVLNSISFNISSDFGEEIRQPLIIKFFEDWTWGFDKFSDELLSKSWGCFDATNKNPGPLIGNSFYCEMISIGNSDILRVGADVIGNGSVLNMTVYPDSGFGASWKCNFNPNIEDGCEISPDAGDIFSAGDYQVCVGADSLTSYNIYQDESGKSCGFTYDNGPSNSVKDYGIFAQGVKYARAEEMDNLKFGDDSVLSANHIISKRYGGNCSKGCILPLEISGVSQNFRIFNVKLVYTDNSEWKSNNMVYVLNKTSADVDFNGILDLSLLGMKVSGPGEYFAKLSGKDLFRVNVTLFPSPIISSVMPLNPPAGVPVTFYANVDFKGNESLSYRWDFGDNKSISTSVPYVVHSYDNLNNYTLTLNVSAGGNLSSKKSFGVKVISPEFAVDARLKSMQKSMQNVKNTINGFPVWYGKDVFNILNIANIESELQRLNTARNNSFDVIDFKNVAEKLYSMDVPVAVGINSFESPFLPSELSDVHVNPVAMESGSVSGASDDKYAGPILTWQNNNIDVLMKSKDIFSSYLGGGKRDVLSVYDFNVTSRSSEESYFVINKPFSELYFNGDVGARKAGDATVIILNAGETKSFEFYYKNNTRGSFFVSPRLSSILIESKIDTNCNFNKVCEENLGENYDNCRSDCKPVGKSIFFLSMVILFFLVAYSGLQIWYKRHYENYLFKDRSQLYNMLMYVSNARARDIEDLRIRAELIAKGWGSERVNYIIKKSLGKSVGMVEIIPISKISALFRDWRARKAVMKAREVAARTQANNTSFKRVP